VEGAIENFVDTSGFNYSTGIHDTDPFCQSCDYRKVMGNPDQCRPGFSAEALDLMQNLPLDGNI